LGAGGAPRWGPPRLPHARCEPGTRRLPVSRRAGRLRWRPEQSPRGGLLGPVLNFFGFFRLFPDFSDFFASSQHFEGPEANEGPGRPVAAGGGGLMFRPGNCPRAGRPSGGPDRAGRPVPVRFLTPGLAVALAALVGGVVYLAGRPPTTAAPRAQLHGRAG